MFTTDFNTFFCVTVSLWDWNTEQFYVQKMNDL